MVAAMRVLPPRGQRPWVAASLLILGLSLALGLLFSRLHWGYWFTPPAPDLSVLNAGRYAGIAALRVNGDSARFEPREKLLLLQRGHLRHPGDFAHARLLGLIEPWGLPGELPEASADALRVASEVMADVPPPEEASGFVLEVDTEYSERLMFFGLTRLVGDDHHESREVLVRQDSSGGQILSSSVYYYDVAGMEGIDWRTAAVMSVPLVSFLMLPLVALTGLVQAHRRAIRT